MRVWGANRIRDPGSPLCELWRLCLADPKGKIFRLSSTIARLKFKNFGCSLFRLEERVV